MSIQNRIQTPLLAAIAAIAAIAIMPLLFTAANAAGINTPLNHPGIPCPTTRSGCAAGAAEADVPHDFPPVMFTLHMQNGCIQAAARAHNLNPRTMQECHCMADSVGATPGEWRVIVAGYAENTLKTTAPASPLGEQINQQMRACKGEIGNMPGRGGPSFAGR